LYHIPDATQRFAPRLIVTQKPSIPIVLLGISVHHPLYRIIDTSTTLSTTKTAPRSIVMLFLNKEMEQFLSYLTRCLNMHVHRYLAQQLRSRHI
jgi:hypothetical protein